jgi:hypothetical protein
MPVQRRFAMTDELGQEKAQGLKNLRENYHLEIESRRDG